MRIFLLNRPQNHGVRNPTTPSQISCDFAEFRQIERNFPESRPYRRAGRMADPRTAEISHDCLQILLLNRPQNHGVENSTLAAQISGDFAEFRQIGRNFPESIPFAAEPTGWRIREPPQFPRIPWGEFLHNRPQNHGGRNPTLSAQVSGYFAEFRQIARNFHESRPFSADPAGRRIREPPKFPRI